MYLIEGQLHEEFSLDAALDRLSQTLPLRLNLPLHSETVIRAAAAFAARLSDSTLALPLDAGQRQSLIEFCQPSPTAHREAETAKAHRG